MAPENEDRRNKDDKRERCTDCVIPQTHALHTSMAVMEVRYETVLAALETNTKTMSKLADSINDYPVTRERVNNMWRIITGMIGMMLMLIGGAVWLLIKSGV